MLRISLVVIVACVVLAPAASAAPFADLTFTSILEDPAGFSDIKGVSFGEPGDQTLVMKYDVGSADDASGIGYDVLFFSVGDKRYAPGMKSDGTPTHFGNTAFEAVDPTSCQLDGASFYCVLTYESLGAMVGTQLTKTNAISYLQSAQDSAPCPGGYAVCAAQQISATGGYGIDYTLTGCTKAGGCAAVVSTTGPKVHNSNLTGDAARITIGFSAPTNDTYSYNWTAPAADLASFVNVTVLSGKVAISIKDDKGAAVFTETFTATKNSTSPTKEATGGPWTITAVYTSFTGNVEVAIVKAASKLQSTTTTTGAATTSSESATTSGTGTGGETTTSADTSGLGLVALAACLAVGLLLARRRLE